MTKTTRRVYMTLREKGQVLVGTYKKHGINSKHPNYVSFQTAEALQFAGLARIEFRTFPVEDKPGFVYREYWLVLRND